MLQAPTPPDGGMLYTETNLQHLFPEPWNMVTSALFLIPAFYWIIKLKVFNREYTFLSIAVWILLVGCIGSTVYHGLRQWRIFIFMDWVPIALLCLLASIYFWMKLIGKWLYGMIALGVFVGTEIILRQLWSGISMHILISVNYGIMVLMIVLLLILLLVKMRGHNAWLVAIAFMMFALALFFRVADQWAWLSIGTHFLWHTFGAIATSVILVFIYRLKQFKA
ncbi:hypothetical protein KHS38_09405 [Mucilaginibacter sp. Bleaf8]|uniref:hypothetical protein n=1 Tax=Mucilaginibacter sp. Bleaf8 TaxID=2834430 RepID=UPI001BCBF22E|nr:hypothetical protein [Mucilaginibacter sp. Bleaf8]MBS7564622.1 hypothetical protein [Mucilaginibacter sp. Bleaf8]